MKRIIVMTLLSLPSFSNANDSTGYVGTGGIQYLKNNHITMLSEDLWISKKQIKVNYQFKNLSSQDITETILFPLPKVDNFFESDFADTKELLSSFKVQVNGQEIKPEMHVRVFIQKDEKSKSIDATEIFKQCGFTSLDMLNPWSRKTDENEVFETKLRACSNPKLQTLLPDNRDEVVMWSSQVIYSWKQIFKAKSITKVQHQYVPLVGGSVAMYSDEYNQQFCMDQNFKQGLKKAKAEDAPFSALSYILTTGANWAKPIENFKLTIERDANELVSFCWDGEVKKVSATQFQMTQKNFRPRKDLDIIFVKK